MKISPVPGVFTILILVVAFLIGVSFPVGAEENPSDGELLLAAARKGNLVEIGRLLDSGVDVNLRGSGGWTALLTALSVKQQTAVKLLLEAKADPNLSGILGIAPLMFAADAETAQLLIQHGAKIKNLDEPILPRMIQFSSAEAMEEVLRAGADSDHSILQQTLLAACHMNRGEMARVVLKHGGNPNEPILWAENISMLPLLACCVFDSVKTARVLLENGGDPNGGEKPGILLKTAMHNRYQEMTRVLRDAGAEGSSDLAISLAVGNVERVRELLKTAPMYASDAAFWEDVLTNAAVRGDRQTVEAALDHGVPVRVSDEQDGYRAAASEGQYEVLQLLLEAPHQKESHDDLQSALWEAVWNSRPYKNQRPAEAFENTIKLLLAAGGTPSGPDWQPPLMIAAVFTRNPGGSPQAVQLLAEAGVDVNPNFQGKTLMEMVRQSCAENTCATPLVECVTVLKRLVGKEGVKK